MNHTHYVLFKAYESELVAILPKDFNDTTLAKVIKDEEGGVVKRLSYDKGELGRVNRTPIGVDIDGDYNVEYYLQPTWLYENE